MPIQLFAPQNHDSIYGALAGGFLTGGIAILVNYLSNRQSLQKLDLELSHQAQQRENERQLSLKREIYIPLMEAASNAMSFYAQIGSVPTELIRRPEPLNALARHISQMSVVASKNVMETVHTAQKHLLLEVLKLFEERIPIESILVQMESVESQIKIYESKSASFTERFEKHIDAGTGNAGLKEVLMRLMNEHQEILKKLHEQKSSLLKQKSALELKIAMLAAQGAKAMNPGTKAALVAIRTDLGFPVEEKWLSDLMDAKLNEVFEAVEKFSNNIKKMVTESKSGTIES